MSLKPVENSCRGITHATPDPCVMVIFGASGDLTGRSLLPSLFDLAQKDLLPRPFAVIGMAKSSWSDGDFRKRMRAHVERECDFDASVWDRLAGQLYFIDGDFSSAQDFQTLRDRIEGLRAELDIPNNLFFHLATPPSFFGTIAEQLDRAGLAKAASEQSVDDAAGWRRIVIEKPFGEDRDSARALHRDLLAVFDERQIYRIDHFLGKETVQNMLVFRFANPSFEPIWNRHYIDHVQITVAEDIGINTRGAFYEKTGVVRDMVQNHLLQLLCMVAVEPPIAYDARALRDETVKVLRAIRPPQPEDIVCGQYDSGSLDGQDVAAYRDEDDVAEDSETSTFAALRLDIQTGRWAGVPFYLRTGKRMARKLTEISVHFKPTACPMFPVADDSALHKNVLTFRLAPDEGIVHTFIAKQPGSEICLTPVASRFLYADAFGIESPPRAYAWLILDVMEGEQTLFAREDWVDQAWAIVDPIVERLQADPPQDFPNYAAGSWGPPAAAELLERDGRTWDARD